MHAFRQTIIATMLMLVLSIMALASGAFAQTFTFTIIDFPGATLTEAHGINASGQIVGSYRDNANIKHGFLAR